MLFKLLMHVQNSEQPSDLPLFLLSIAHIQNHIKVSMSVWLITARPLRSIVAPLSVSLFNYNCQLSTNMKLQLFKVEVAMLVSHLFFALGNTIVQLKHEDIYLYLRTNMRRFAWKGKRWNYKLPRSLWVSYFCTGLEQKCCVSHYSFCVTGDFMGKLVLRGSYLLKSTLVNWDIFAF